MSGHSTLILPVQGASSDHTTLILPVCGAFVRGSPAGHQGWQSARAASGAANRVGGTNYTHSKKGQVRSQECTHVRACVCVRTWVYVCARECVRA